ncbi:MAG TPA: wax ester/triacylglycerol synthase family O-acyltransferase [Pseudonocardiaceae bacterium]|nr:wax ester/triacylglycerol synthase family O-acyltransferase [Pseudonocardiaceae bacterium]
MNRTQLTGLDTAFLCLEGPSAPMSIGAVAIFAPSQASHPTRLVRLLSERAAAIPRLRQRIESSWLSLTGVRWADDPDFQAEHHIHAHRLSRPHQESQLTTLAGTIMGRRLDMSRPLWELHLITGLPGGRFAILAKLHHALADGAAAIMLSLGLLDGFTPAAATEAEQAPTLLGAPAKFVKDTVTGLPEQLRQARQTADITASVLRNTRAMATDSPLRAGPSTRRKLATLRLSVADIKQVRALHGGTTNDVLLAVLSGALRNWLGERGQRVDELALRALIPVNQRRRDAATSGTGNRLSGYLCDLPVDLRDPVRRLRAVRAEMDRNKAAGPFRGPGALPVLADRAPAVLHRLATPLLGRAANLLFDTVITNLALPNVPLSFAGASLREIYPVLPIAYGHALGIALCSYQNSVHIGLHVNAAALPDVDQLRDAIPEALTELAQARTRVVSELPTRSASAVSAELTRAEVAPSASIR